MLFSVVVPTHHRPESLDRLLDSLTKQSLDHQAFEVLIIPSPQDKSLNQLTEKIPLLPFSTKILIPTADPFSGKSASFKRNYGAKNAIAEWIAFIDDDCVADPLWLAQAATQIHKWDLHGIEGLTEIPIPEKITFTYKGIKRLSSQGGYQTCNMFYRKQTFIDLGGFDLKFPFYLEDTDLAWTFLDNKKYISFLDTAIVQHPVPAPEVKRLLDNAWRTRLLPYLYKKHPEQFTHSDFKPLNPSQWAYLILYFGSIYSVLVSPNKLLTLSIMLIGIVLYNTAYTYRLLKGCHFEKKELFEIFIYLPIAPVIAFTQLIRGNIENKTFLFLKKS